MLYNVLEFLIGLGIFVFAVKILGGALERLSSVKIKKGLTRLSKNSVSGIGFGTLMAFVTQSSLASVVMTMSFADGLMLSLFSSVAIIFGCNIGTSLSTILMAFSSLSITKFLALLTLVGALIATFAKNKKAKEVGTIIASFGMFFVGLNLLSSSCAVLKTSSTVLNFFTSINNPILYLLLGIVLTLITQSSTVTIAILISLVGINGFDVISITNCAYCIYGSNIGTALTAMLLSFTGGVESKKVAFSHVVFNLIGTFIFIVFTILGYLKIFNFIKLSPSFTIVIINIIFNVVTAVLLFAFIKPLTKFCNFCIREKVKKEDEIYFLRPNHLSSSTVATQRLNLCVIDLIQKIEVLSKEIQAYSEDYTITHSINITKKLEKISSLNERVQNNILKVQADLIGEEENIYFLQVTNKNIERIIRNYFRLIKYVKYNKDNKIIFTQKQTSTFKTMYDCLETLTKNVKIIVEFILNNAEKRDYYIPNLQVIRSNENINDIVSKIKREMIATNIYTEKKIDKCAMFTDVVNCIADISANYTDICLTVTNYLTKNKEQIVWKKT